jgi:hypothetical protein
MDPIVARKCWRTLEPYHGLVYFASEATERYAALGIEGQNGYFASRAAPMGAVPAEVVIATFYNFHPALVRAAVPAVWAEATPSQLVDARLAGIDVALRDVLGDDAVRSGEVLEAAGIAQRATDTCRPEGRPLYAGHASLDWPDEPHLVLWHAVTLLREFRGDGHVAALLDADVAGCEALVMHAATGEVPAAALQSTRAWSDVEWAAAVERLAERGIVDAEGGFTDAGRTMRAEIEGRTDALALAPWASIGDDACAALREMVRPLSRAIVESGRFGFDARQPR